MLKFIYLFIIFSEYMNESDTQKRKKNYLIIHRYSSHPENRQLDLYLYNDKS